MRVEILSHHIAFGEPQDVHKCALARAIREVISDPLNFPQDPGDVDVSMGAAFVRLPGSDRDETYRLPPAAREFVANFDDHKPVKPFTFYLEPFNPFIE